MKVGIYTQSRVGTSETFVLDLLRAFHKDNEVEPFLVSGSNKLELSDDLVHMAQFATGFESSSTTTAFRLYSVVSIIRGKEKAAFVKLSYQQRVAHKRVNNTLVPDVAYVEYANTAVLLRPYFKANSIPFVCHVHGHDITVSANDPAYLEELRGVFMDCSAMICASNHMRRLLILLGCDERKIHVIRIGVDVQNIVPLSWAERIKSPPSFIYLGRLTPKKHPIALLHAFHLVKQEIENAELTIIGEGPEREGLEQRVSDLNLSESVKMMGKLSREEAFEHLNGHWIYVQHSVTAPNGDQEGYALSIAEAAAHELPVVTTLHNGITEHVVEGETGYMVQEFDFESMAKRLIMLARNPQLCEQLGKQGRKNIAKINDGQVRYRNIRVLLDQASEI